MEKEKTKPIKDSSNLAEPVKDLILFNDEVNTFDWVIETLVEVCGHDACQAETCAYVAHYNGKCPVKSGTLSELKPKYNEMTRRGLTVEIE